MFVFANVLQPLIDVFEALLLAIHGVIGSWGWSIVAMTVVIRAALLPLTFKQFKSMQNLQRHAPELKALQEKYKDDKQRLNQEMMRFYQENKINPLGSCLPLLAQMPVFISLFYLLQKDLRVEICGQSAKPCGEVPPGNWGESFLFIPDLTDKATGGVLAVLIVLYIGSQVASTLLMSVTADKNQRRLFLALPFVFVLFIINFPAGLILYWITTNVWTIGQQWIVRRTVGPIKPPAPAGAAAATGGGSSSSGGLLAGLLGGAAGGGGDGKGADGKKAGVGANGKAEGDAKPKAKPPPPPRKKRKTRSGRRR